MPMATISIIIILISSYFVYASDILKLIWSTPAIFPNLYSIPLYINFLSLVGPQD